MNPERSELAPVVELIAREAGRFLDGLDERAVRCENADEAARAFRTALPSEGSGALATLRKLIEEGESGVIGSAGPRFFHFVIGGATPAALGADWLASTYDQLSSAWVTSPLTVELELVALDWLRELFGLAPDARGVMTTGAMMANFTCLGAARQWWGEQLGVDIAERGLHGLPQMQVLSSGYIHATCYKALAMLGHGRDCVRTFARDGAGRLDADALEAALAEDDSPKVIVANAGEVNAGDFDPINTMADLAERYGAWLHVDGAFGLFAGVTPQLRHLVAGVERADSATSDGHKWLNVPYDCGFAFVRDLRLLASTFRLAADYLPDPDDPAPMLSSIGPESSRRARSLSVWATLHAYGKTGLQRMIEDHRSLTRHLAARVDETPELERLAEAPLNIVCYRFNPGGKSEAELDAVNRALSEAILEDGQVYVGSTLYDGRVALRPAIVNWRTSEADIDLLVERSVAVGRRVAERALVERR